MRGNPECHEFIAPPNLDEVLAKIASDPGSWTVLAGGTELMVAHAAGKLNAPKLISLWGLPELGTIHVDCDSISIGAGVTFQAIRQHPTIAAEFPLLSRASSWIGSIANQSRATIAGNIVNGSPAADAPPSLLVYEAEIELVSQGHRRRMPYQDFHLGYKRSVLKPEELVFALHLPRRFSKHKQYLRKVGTRKAMAITKVALAGTAIVEEHVVKEIRIAAASVADRPMRLRATENELLGRAINTDTRLRARRTLMDEVRPIDDIRSSAEYRRQVAANLLDEYLDELSREGPGA